jgi:hypothetical protein
MNQRLQTLVKLIIKDLTQDLIKPSNPTLPGLPKELPSISNFTHNPLVVFAKWDTSSDRSTTPRQHIVLNHILCVCVCVCERERERERERESISMKRGVTNTHLVKSHKQYVGAIPTITKPETSRLC